MTKALETYTREELEKKVLHMTSFMAYHLASEYIELTEPLAKIIRTAESEAEHTAKILEYIVCIFPAWDIIEKTHPGYDVMTEWVKKNHEQALEKPCVCDGCVVDVPNDKVN